jgi:hypothetical protein
VTDVVKKRKKSPNSIGQTVEIGSSFHFTLDKCIKISKSRVEKIGNQKLLTLFLSIYARGTQLNNERNHLNIFKRGGGTLWIDNCAGLSIHNISLGGVTAVVHVSSPWTTVPIYNEEHPVFNFLFRLRGELIYFGKVGTTECFHNQKVQ